MRRLSLLLGALTLSTASSAAQADASSSTGSSWGLGLTVGLDRKPYRDFDDETQVLPLLVYENRWVRVAGPTLDLKLLGRESWTAGLRLRYAGDGYEADDSPFLQGMAERKSSFWLGGAAAWRTGWATLSAEVLGDASGHSKGTRMSLGVERRFSAGAFDLTPRVVGHRVDRKFVDYYYGVRAEEATARRAAHAGAASTNLELGLRVGYAIAPRHRLSLDLSTTRLGDAIQDSPLVERRRQDSARLSYLYLF
ncbi:MipA/OmpV family protein [Mitsuaria sp. GD03876]|uniref:MipA/OmpV family protein n=1 Tax=Mitsuaria sp. GD03876 TaxID=2975399 RepID=UPI00244CA7E2|nr:MipA/OmpV family protein [Mitsuaria sp. GD03876]MDH0864322.1 MipA/OmpV family protein [Mitsuaria sp. GD03876]